MNEPRFYTKDLTIGYRKSFSILENINLEVPKGTICALIGSNGSGKSTFVKTIAGLVKQLNGTYHHAKNSSISMVPQVKKIRIDYPITVQKMLTLPEEAGKWIFRKVGFLEAGIEVLKETDVYPILNLMIRECSGGQLQKVLIARSLLSNANLIFLDEPMDALDRKSQERIFELLKRQSIEFQKTFFVITHNTHDSWMSNFDVFYKVKDKTIVRI